MVKVWLAWAEFKMVKVPDPPENQPPALSWHGKKGVGASSQHGHRVPSPLRLSLLPRLALGHPPLYSMRAVAAVSLVPAKSPETSVSCGIQNYAHPPCLGASSGAFTPASSTSDTLSQ
eukprot:5888270-Prymnesium_polylepis.1